VGEGELDIGKSAVSLALGAERLVHEPAHANQTPDWLLRL